MLLPSRHRLTSRNGRARPALRSTALRRGAIPLPQLFGVAVVLGAIYVGRESLRGGSDDATADRTVRTSLTVPGADTAPSTAPTAAESIGTFKVRGLDGKVVPLVVPGQAAIVMVSSRTCTWCKRTLKDLGEMSGGRALPNLTLLTLEGAEEGVPMMRKEGLVGARYVGPAGNADQVLLTFRYPGTPTFVAIDRNGRVVRTMPGYPIREELKHWYAVMVGDQEVP